MPQTMWLLLSIALILDEATNHKNTPNPRASMLSRGSQTFQNTILRMDNALYGLSLFQILNCLIYILELIAVGDQLVQGELTIHVELDIAGNIVFRAHKTS